MNSVLLILFVAFVAKSEAKIFTTNPKEVQILSVKSCPNVTNIWTFGAKFHKYNRTTQVVDANLTLLEDFTDDFSLNIEMRRWGDGGWKHNFIRLNKKKGCTTYLTVLGDSAKEILMLLGRPPTCPVTKGSVQMKNLVINTDKSPLAAIKGRYLVILKIMKLSQVMVCAEALIEIKEKD